MGLPELALLACMMLQNGGHTLSAGGCLKQMDVCVMKKKLEAVAVYASKSTEAKVSPADMIAKAPEGQWSEWILECQQEAKQHPQK